MPSDPFSADAGTIQHGTGAGGSFRWITADVTPGVERMRARLDLSPVAAAAFGQALAGGVLLAQTDTKRPALLKLDLRGDGPLGRIIAEVEDGTTLRGLVAQPRVDVPNLPDGGLDVSAAVGRGILRVLREFRGANRYESQVELATGHLATDLTHYLDQSEQRRSAMLLGVLARREGITAACGILVEALPKASDEVLERLASNLEATTEVSRIMEEGGLPKLKNRALNGFDRVLRQSLPLEYRCRCDRERLLHSLMVMPGEDRGLLDDPEAGGISAECAYCGEVYTFSSQELGSGDLHGDRS